MIKTYVSIIKSIPAYVELNTNASIVGSVYARPSRHRPERLSSPRPYHSAASAWFVRTLPVQLQLSKSLAVGHRRTPMLLHNRSYLLRLASMLGIDEPLIRLVHGAHQCRNV